jgi:hypothetical protein
MPFHNHSKCATLFKAELFENYSFNCDERVFAQSEMENSLRAIKAEIATSNS